MPKVFLVRKFRQHCRTGPCGTVTPPPSPEQGKQLNAPKVEDHHSNPETAQSERWVESWHATVSDGGSEENSRTPPVSPRRPHSPLAKDFRYQNSVHYPIYYSPESMSPKDYRMSSVSPIPPHSRPKSPSQPPYLAVPVIQSIVTQDRPLDYHMPRANRPPSETHEEVTSTVDPYQFDSRPQSPHGSDSSPPMTPDHEDDDLDERGISAEALSLVPSLPVRLALLQQRLGLPADTPLEFVNGGHGIKNPLLQRAQRHSLSNNQVASPVNSHPDVSPTGNEDNNRLNCKVCGKSFGLQRLLNRHMKCHSDMKRYLCTFCGKGFNDTFDLKRHTRTHTGVRPYKCSLCEKSFTQRCSLESHTLKVHGIQHTYAYKERRAKVYVCEECGHTTNEPEVHYLHLKDNHPYSPALLKFYDKRHFKFSDGSFPVGLLRIHS